MCSVVAAATQQQCFCQTRAANVIRTLEPMSVTRCVLFATHAPQTDSVAVPLKRRLHKLARCTAMKLYLLFRIHFRSLSLYIVHELLLLAFNFVYMLVVLKKL